MNLPRHFLDEADEVYLVVPDAMSVDNLTWNANDEVGTVGLSIALKVDPKSLEQFAAARPCQLSNLKFYLEAPSDPRVLSFDVAKTTPSSANIILTCEASDIDDIVKVATTDSAYFSPEYRANSEDYMARVMVAQANLDQKDIQEINAASGKGPDSSIANFVLRLVEYIRKSSASNGREVQLATKAMNRYVNITLEGAGIADSDPAGDSKWWKISFAQTSGVEVELSELQTKTSFVIMRAADIHLIVTYR